MERRARLVVALCIGAVAGLIIAGVAIYLSRETPLGEFGRFVGKVNASWSDDGRTMRLTEPFTYVDGSGKEWLAPLGAEVDGASIPRAFWTLVGGPFEGQYRNASVIHDVACRQRTETSDDVHLMFYNACRCGGVAEQKAKVLYMAVYHFGPHWPPPGSVRSGDGNKSMAPLMMMREAEVDEEQARALMELVEKQNLSLEEIRALQPATPGDVIP